MLLTWQETRDILSVSHKLHAILYGPPGTGKTQLAVSQKNGNGVYSITLTEDSSAPDLLGHFVVGQGGEFKFHYGPATRAWKEGAVLVLNEVDRAQGGAAIALHAILDDQEIAQLTLTNNETVHPKSGFRCIATMNGSLEDLDDALRDRFSLRILIDTPSKEAFDSLKDRRVRSVCRNWYDNGEVSQTTFRTCQSMDDLIGLGVQDEVAAKAIYGDNWYGVLNALRYAV